MIDSYYSRYSSPYNGVNVCEIRTVDLGVVQTIPGFKEWRPTDDPAYVRIAYLGDSVLSQTLYPW
jgi:hypothetical protein